MGENWKRNPGPRRSPKVPCIQVPPSAQDTYLLKDLKRGQKCYLYSIMRVYDSKPLREMLSHQYMLNLQRQNLLGKCQLVLLCASAVYRNWSLEALPSSAETTVTTSSKTLAYP
uniref:Protein FAM216B n=1 Tax=Chelydra serpentina TaxID=8475 RepID=A0A8C3TDD0_CHESE